MARSKIWTALAAAIIIVSTGASARPKRTVVLLDFSRSQPVEAVEGDQLRASIDIDALSRLMARQFTGAPAPTAALQLDLPLSPVRRIDPALLGNPFVTRAAYAMPVVPALAAESAGECVIPIYRPSAGFGRQAEERRRVIFPLVQQAACESGLPVGLFDALVMQESRYRPTIVSPKGALGLAQLMPDTAAELGVNRYSLLDNLRGGARYLRLHIDQFGRYDLALAAYNAGPHRRSLRMGQIPNIAETQNYVRTILGNWSGASPAIAHTIPASRPLNFRQAQLIFMAYRGSEN